MTSTRGSILGATAGYSGGAPGTRPTRSTSAGLWMGVTWPVSSKRMVLASYAPSKWLDRAGSEKRARC